MWRPLFLLTAALRVFICAATAMAADFATQIHPILAARCTPCHSGDKPPAGLSFASRETALKGGVNGAAFKPGDSKGSLMILKVTHQKSPVMPPTGEPLSSEQIALLKTWIDEGAAWPDTSSANSTIAWVAPIAPRLPAVPEGTESNPIDRFVAAYFAKNNGEFPQPVPDAMFARRVYLDVWGIPPTAAQLEKFVGDRDPNKREHLVDFLLSDREMYAGNWISWWNDLLRNDMGVNYQGDRKSITPWLLSARREYGLRPHGLGVAQPDGKERS
jgi:hypothetical protein